MTIIPKSIVGVATRLTEQDDCDIPLTTPNRMLADNGFIKVSFEPDVEDGAEIISYLADGSICVQDMDDPRIKGWKTTLQICLINPLYSTMLIGGATLLDENAEVKGGVFPGFGAPGKRNSKQFEVWARNADRSGCINGQRARYVRWLAPRTVAWKPSDALTFEKGAHQTLGFEGYAEANENFTPVLGLDPAVDENAPAADQDNNPPAGTAFDPDLNYADVLSFRNHGGLGFVGSNTLPAFAAAGSFAA